MADVRLIEAPEDEDQGNAAIPWPTKPQIAEADELHAPAGILMAAIAGALCWSVILTLLF